MELKWTVGKIVVTTRESDAMKTSQKAKDKYRKDPGPCKERCLIITITHSFPSVCDPALSIVTLSPLFSALEINIKADFKNQP